MKKLIAGAVFAITIVCSTLGSQADSVKRVEVGVLNCIVEGGTGFIFGSSKDLSCTFEPVGENAVKERYFGAITKYGLDVGKTQSGVIAWGVLAPTSDTFRPGALAGNYLGVSAQTTVGAGLGANALIGGSNKTVALQPVSVSAQTGLNLALAIGQLELRAAAD